VQKSEKRKLQKENIIGGSLYTQTFTKHLPYWHNLKGEGKGNHQ
jgi:hypothetical protein